MKIPSHRFASTLLLIAGLGFVFAGVGTALGSSLTGIVASLAAVGGLLYAGAVWFSPRGAADRVSGDAAVIFTHALLVASGGSQGRPLSSRFSPGVWREMEPRCRGALLGQAARFACEVDGGAQLFEVVPVRGADGAILYGLLLSGALAGAADPMPTA